MKLEINFEQNQDISNAIFDALKNFLCENIDFHGERHTVGAGMWVYETVKGILSGSNDTLEDLQTEFDELPRSAD